MRFRVTLLSTALAVIGVAGTIALGNWQTGRARDKSQLQAEIDAGALAAPISLTPQSTVTEGILYRRVEVQGRFDTSHTIILDNKLRAGVAGYEVVTPLALGSNKALLINRGWVAASLDRNRLPEVPTPDSDVTVIGLALPPTSHFVELSEETVQGNLWQNLDFKRYAKWSGLDLLPLVVQLQSEFPDGLKRQWPRPDMRIDTHRAYAMQWYTMSVAIFILYLYMNVRRR